MLAGAKLGIKFEPESEPKLFLSYIDNFYKLQWLKIHKTWIFLFLQINFLKPFLEPPKWEDPEPPICGWLTGSASATLLIPHLYTQRWAVLRIRNILIRIRGLKKFVTDPDPDRTLIRIKSKTVRIRIQAKKGFSTGDMKIVIFQQKRNRS